MSEAADGSVARAVGGLAEATVVGRAQDGDLVAFEQLARHYQGPLFRLAYRLLGDRGEAEDALQDTMVQVWRKLPGLAEPVAFRSWIYQIMTRRCLSLLRSRARRAVDPVDSDDLDHGTGGRTVGTGEDGGGPADAAEQAARLRDLNEVLTQLPADQRACWVLRELHGLSYAEIAYATNLSASTVRGRLGRARQNWREEWTHGGEQRLDHSPGVRPRHRRGVDLPRPAPVLPRAALCLLPGGSHQSGPPRPGDGRAARRRRRRSRTGAGTAGAQPGDGDRPVGDPPGPPAPVRRTHRGRCRVRPDRERADRRCGGPSRR